MSIHLWEVLADAIHRLRAASAFVSLLALLGLALVALFAGISRPVYGSVVVASGSCGSSTSREMRRSLLENPDRDGGPR